MTDIQSAACVLMIRPAAFAANEQTRTSNRFQSREAALSAAAAQRAAAHEFDELVAALGDADVEVIVFEDAPEPLTPDAVFPNNWVSFHADGTVVLYPMLAENRRLERREDILQTLSARDRFRISRVIDLSRHERNGQFLEGTGSMVLDRAHRIAYACLSPRTDPEALADFAQQLDYDVVAFEATDQSSVPIYHTNVMMCVGERFAAVCVEAIREQERAAVLDALRTTGHELVQLTHTQMGEFAGNMLELRTRAGATIVTMSARAHGALTPEQCAALEQHGGRIVTASIPTIEMLGGGSVRCMLAEVFLPRKQ